MKLIRIVAYILIAFVSLILHASSLYGQTKVVTPIEKADSLPNDSIVITVKVAFIVNTEGEISSVRVVETVCDSTISERDCKKKKIRKLKKEAVRVVKGTSPWKPVKQDGKAVKVKYILPIRFRLLRSDFIE